MRIHHQIRAPACVLVEWHIFLRHNQTNYSFLAVSGRELVSNLRDSRLSVDHFDLERVIRSRAEDHPINIGWIGVLVRIRRRSPLLDQVCGRGTVHQELSCRLIDGRGVLVHKDVAIFQLRTDVCKAIWSKGLKLLGSVRIDPTITAYLRLRRLLNHVHHISVFVPREIGGMPPHTDSSAKSPIETRLVQDDCILDIIASVGHNGDTCILTSWNLLKVDHLKSL